MWPGAVWANILCRLLDNRIIRLRGHKKQYGKVRPGNRYLPQPDEAYAFWDHFTGIDFSRDFLLGLTADSVSGRRVCEALEKTLAYQGKVRFATKLTGPGRIYYLLSIFPDARFVHVIRDGRAAVESLLRVAFWREKGGLDAPFWANGLETAAIDDWVASGKDPVILASHEWRKIVQTTREEAHGLGRNQYTEVKYEDFVGSPRDEIDRLSAWAGLAGPGDVRFETPGAGIVDMNRKYLEVFSDVQIDAMDRVMGPMLGQLGYRV